MTKPTFSTIDSSDLSMASGGNTVDVPTGTRNPWGTIASPGTPPFFPRPTPTFPGPTFPFPTGPTGPTGPRWPGGNGPFAGTNEPPRTP